MLWYKKKYELLTIKNIRVFLKFSSFFGNNHLYLGHWSKFCIFLHEAGGISICSILEPYFKFHKAFDTMMSYFVIHLNYCEIFSIQIRLIPIYCRFDVCQICRIVGRNWKFMCFSYLFWKFLHHNFLAAIICINHITAFEVYPQNSQCSLLDRTLVTQ